MRTAVIVVAGVLAIAVFTVGTASAAEVKVLASNAIKTVLEELGPQFEKTTKHKLIITYGSSAKLQAEIEKGAAFDLAILSTAVIDEQIRQGRLVGATRADIARSGAGLAVRKGAPKPDISTTEAFKRTLLAAKSLGYSETGMAGLFFMNIFQRLGITEEMKPKLKLSRPNQPTLQALANGEVNIVLPQISEALVFPGVDLVGPLPPEVQVYTVIPAAIATSATEPDAAKALLKFLATPDAIRVLKAKGLEPG